MTVKELMKQLRKLYKVHPEVKEADVFASHFDENIIFSVNYVGFRKKLKRPMVVLEGQ